MKAPHQKHHPFLVFHRADFLENQKLHFACVLDHFEFFEIPHRLPDRDPDYLLLVPLFSAEVPLIKHFYTIKTEQSTASSLTPTLAGELCEDHRR